MHIELLSSPGCPNTAVVRRLLIECLSLLGIQEVIQERVGRVASPSVLIDGKPLDPARRYKVAANDFMLRGGDGYTALRRGKILVGNTDGKIIASLVMSHIRALGTVGAKVEGRIQID